jgi:hypothetical protein
MPRLGLEVVYRSDDYVYYVGDRTAVGIRRLAPELAGHAHEELAPGIDHLCFRARSGEDIDELYLSLAELGAGSCEPRSKGLTSSEAFAANYGSSFQTRAGPPRGHRPQLAP